MTDSQIVLRFFAFRDPKLLKGSVRSMLDQFMKDNQNPSAEEIANLRESFRTCLGLARKIFGDETFRLPASRGGKLSVPLYDAVMVALHLEADRGNAVLDARIEIRARLSADLEKRRAYEILIGRPNTAAAIVARIDRVRKIIRSAARK